MGQFTLTAKNISMDFPGVKALDGIDFEIKSGEIRAVVGVNGAGKSTLMKIFSGICPAYDGEIYCNGEKVSLRTVQEAGRLGIRTVYQEVDEAIVPDFTVYENLLLENLTLQAGNCFYSRRRMKQEAEAILAGLGIDLEAGALAKNLTLAQKRMLLIAKEVHKKCNLLILDEPTTAFGKAETQKLFQLIRWLAEKKNTAVIFISHKLAELLEICNSCTVIRDGKLADEFPVGSDTRTEVIVERMFGGDTLGKFRNDGGEGPVPVTNPARLEVVEVCDREGRLKRVSFHVKKGEIVGLAGHVGAGKTEICKLLFGAGKKAAGGIWVNEEEVFFKDTSDAVKHKIALIPEERRKEGIFPQESIMFNLFSACLDKFCSFSVLHKKKMKKRAGEAIKEFGIACGNEKQKIQFLSGGNQQKAVIGKWIEADCDIYILDEPMQGIDVGAKQEIFRLIKGMARRGAAVLYASGEIPELLALTDRIYTLYDGRITAELITRETDEKEIMYYTVGG